MYNLATVIDENTTVSRALNDSDLKRDMELLEKEYLDATKQNVSDKYTFNLHIVFYTSYIIILTIIHIIIIIIIFKHEVILLYSYILNFIKLTFMVFIFNTVKTV